MKACMRRCVAEQILAMPVESSDLEASAAQYAATLRELAGSPPVLDLVHLGLGPGRPYGLVWFRVIRCSKLPMRTSRSPASIRNRRRMTLTYPMLNRSRRILWLVTGSEKIEMLGRLRQGDVSIPAGRIRQDQAVVLADRKLPHGRIGSGELKANSGETCGSESQPITADLL